MVLVYDFDLSSLMVLDYELELKKIYINPLTKIFKIDTVERITLMMCINSIHRSFASNNIAINAPCKKSTFIVIKNNKKNHY